MNAVVEKFQTKLREAEASKRRKLSGVEQAELLATLGGSLGLMAENGEFVGQVARVPASAEVASRAGDEFMRGRLRESGLAGKALGAMSDQEKTRSDAIAAEAVALERSLREGAPMREAHDAAKLYARARAQRAREQAGSGDGLVDLSGEGVPKVEPLRERFRRMRLASYGAPGQPTVYYDGGDAYKDITDLFQVLPTESDDGTARLENAKVEGLADSVLRGHPLSAVQIGVLKELLAKYADQLTALRSSDSYEDYTQVPDPATARLAESNRTLDDDAELLAAADYLGQGDEPEMVKLRESIDRRRDELSDRIENDNTDAATDLLDLGDEGVLVREADVDGAGPTVNANAGDKLRALLREWLPDDQVENIAAGIENAKQEAEGTA